MKVINRFSCPSCGPQKLIGDFGSRTHVLCLNCGKEIALKDIGPVVDVDED